MDIKVTTEQGRVPVTIVHVSGDIDSATYLNFQSAAEKLIENGARYMLVNLKDVPYISSAGLRALHNLFNKLRSIHKDVNDDELRKKMNTGSYKSPYIKVTNLSPQIKDAFEISGFETYIETYDDAGKAVESF